MREQAFVQFKADKKAYDAMEHGEKKEYKEKNAKKFKTTAATMSTMIANFNKVLEKKSK